MTCPCAPAAIDPASIRVVLDTQYGTGTTTGGQVPLYVDAYLPNDGKLHPPVLMVHGGGFTSGKRTDPDIVKMSMALAARGFACFSPNYRLMDEGPVFEAMTQANAEALATSIGKPEVIGALIAAEDIHKARVFLSTTGAREAFGTTQSDWGLLGQSAGGIAVLFTGYAGPDFWAKSKGIGEGVGAVVGLWGALPFETITFPEPPMLLVHGTRDQLLGYKASTVLVEQCARESVSCERITIVDGVHGHDSARIFERPYRGGGVIFDRIASFLTENLVHQ